MLAIQELLFVLGAGITKCEPRIIVAAVGVRFRRFIRISVGWVPLGLGNEFFNVCIVAGWMWAKDDLQERN